MQQHHVTTHHFSQVLLRSSIFLVAFVLSGIISLQLIVPPGFASLLWLPGGLALGFILLWGMRYLPVVAVGAFILNLYITWIHIDTKDVLQYKVWVLDALLVVAPLLQVFIAWVLIRLFMDLRRPFDKTLNIILFAVFAGPAASLVSATFSTASLFFFGLIHQDTFFLNWFALWVGESIGVLIVTPIMIMLFNSNKANRKQVYLLFALPLVLISLAIISVFLLVNRYEYQRVQGLFQTMSKEKAQSIKMQYRQDVHLSEDFGQYVQTHGVENKQHLQQYISTAMARTPDVISMGWLGRANMAALIKKIDAGDMNNQFYTPIHQILPPMVDNQQNNHLGVIRIKSSTMHSISQVFSNSLVYGKEQLIFLDCDLHSANSIGLLVVPIVYNQKVVGCVFSLLNLHHDLMRLFANKKPYDQIKIAFHNLDYRHHNPVLYSYSNPKPAMLHAKFEIKYKQELMLSERQHFDIYLVSSEWYLKNHYSWLVWSMVIGGLFFCILMEILLLIIYGEKEIVQAKVDKQAALLEQEEKTNLLLLQSADEGILGVDAEGLITFANPAVCHILGYEPDDLVKMSIKQFNLLIADDYGKLIIKKNGCFLLHKKYEDTRQECKIQQRQGAWVWVEAIHSKIDNTKNNGYVIMLSDITTQKDITSKLERLAHFDILTGLPNRANFLEYLEKALHRAARQSEIIAVCFLDMDDFKYINDHWGHQLGDEVLKKIPEVLKPFQRDTDYLARLSGDEFGLILHDLSSAAMAAHIIKRYLGAFKDALCVEGNEIQVAFSAGIALFPTGGSTTKELIKNADIAMYRAKEKGKNTFALFNQEASEKIQRYHQINDAFLSAISNDEFYVLYQPQINAITKELYGVEALLRWKHPQLGEILPEEFILIAENTGFIKQIGQWLLQQIAKDYQRLMSVNTDLKISINVSIKQLEDRQFELYIHDFIEENIRPETITIEVTETALMHSFKKISALMSRLGRLGIRFALDDFGMEYSSLNYLKNLNIDCIKIDKNFVRDMCENKVSRAIVQAIIKLAHSLDVICVAEGVETESQYQYLVKNGCDYIQGYYFSKPITLEDLLSKYS